MLGPAVERRFLLGLVGRLVVDAGDTALCPETWFRHASTMCGWMPIRRRGSRRLHADRAGVQCGRLARGFGDASLVERSLHFDQPLNGPVRRPKTRLRSSSLCCPRWSARTAPQARTKGMRCSRPFFVRDPGSRIASSRSSSRRRPAISFARAPVSANSSHDRAVIASGQRVPDQAQFVEVEHALAGVLLDAEGAGDGFALDEAFGHRPREQGRQRSPRSVGGDAANIRPYRSEAGGDVSSADFSSRKRWSGFACRSRWRSTSLYDCGLSSRRLCGRYRAVTMASKVSLALAWPVPSRRPGSRPSRTWA